MRARILTVLRSGGEYRWDHVERLAAQCAEFAPGVPFQCLTEGAGLETDWPGWWAKIEAFRAPGPVLYMDLDTTICGPLAPLLEAAEQHEFIALRDFNPGQRQMGSGLMAWRGDLSRIVREFERAPDEYMARCTTPRWWGDQGFIEPLTPGRAYWQDVVPDAVVSWKKDCTHGVPRGARVICFHGKPRPWDLLEAA